MHIKSRKQLEYTKYSLRFQTWESKTQLWMFRDMKWTSAVSLHPFMQMTTAKPKEGVLGICGRKGRGAALISHRRNNTETTSTQPKKKKKIKELPPHSKWGQWQRERETGVTGSAKRLFRPENRKVAGTEVTHKDFRRTITTTLHLSRSAGPGGTNRRH